MCQLPLPYSMGRMRVLVICRLEGYLYKLCKLFIGWFKNNYFNITLLIYQYLHINYWTFQTNSRTWKRCGSWLTTCDIPMPFKQPVIHRIVPSDTFVSNTGEWLVIVPSVGLWCMLYHLMCRTTNKIRIL